MPHCKEGTSYSAGCTKISPDVDAITAYRDCMDGIIHTGAKW